MVISQLWDVILGHAIHHSNGGNALYKFNSIMWRYGDI